MGKKKVSSDNFWEGFIAAFVSAGVGFVIWLVIINVIDWRLDKFKSSEISPLRVSVYRTLFQCEGELAVFIDTFESFEARKLGNCFLQTAYPTERFA